MEEDGLVGAFVGAKAREVLMTLEEYQQREVLLEDELAAIDAGEEVLEIDAAGGAAVAAVVEADDEVAELGEAGDAGGDDILDDDAPGDDEEREASGGPA
jgi:hypothetical protein